MILVEWADALVIIASNFDLPLFDMAMEKYSQVRVTLFFLFNMNSPIQYSSIVLFEFLFI